MMILIYSVKCYKKSCVTVSMSARFSKTFFTCISDLGA